jgi:hypothetical protein
MYMSEIDELKGQTLRNIQRLDDCTCFIFETAVLNSYSQPRIEGKVQNQPEPEPKTLGLEALVGHSVVRSGEAVDDKLFMEFDNGSVLVIPIDDDSRPGIEAAWYYEPRGSVSRVW